MLLPQLDEKQTASRVRYYLRHDYAKLTVALGKSPMHIKSPVITGMPKADSVGNTLEDRLVKIIDLEKASTFVRLAFGRLQAINPEGAELLFRCYIVHASPEYIANEMYRSVRYIHSKLGIACCQFASCLADVSHGRIDLRVWQ